MDFLRNIVIVLLLSAFAGTSNLSAQSAGDDIIKRPIGSNIDTALFLNTGFMNVSPLPAESLTLPPPADIRYKVANIQTFTAIDKSTQFKAAQLALPLTLVAVSSFGVWDKQAKYINNAVRDGFATWRGEAYHNFDDYVQYLPAAAYFAVGFTSAKSRHNWKERLIVLGTSWAAMGIMVNAIKYTVREPRPYNVEKRNSYPSGHTATAFMGAELVRREYGIGYGIAAYAVACGIGVMRMYNDKHWLNDVIGGAGIGILSAQIGYWLLPYTRKLFGMGRTRSGSSMVVAPFYDSNTGAVGGGMAVSFN